MRNEARLDATWRRLDVSEQQYVPEPARAKWTGCVPPATIRRSCESRASTTLSIGPGEFAETFDLILGAVTIVKIRRIVESE
jgi:hypothetical protein